MLLRRVERELLQAAVFDTAAPQLRRPCDNRGDTDDGTFGGGRTID